MFRFAVRRNGPRRTQLQHGFISMTDGVFAFDGDGYAVLAPFAGYGREPPGPPLARDFVETPRDFVETPRDFVETPRDFVDALLAALTGMAVLSPRRQADVAVAVRRAGLAANPKTIASAIAQLIEEGCISHPLYLSDGGILVSVTMRGIEFLATTSHHHVIRPVKRLAKR